MKEQSFTLPLSLFVSVFFILLTLLLFFTETFYVLGVFFFLAVLYLCFLIYRGRSSEYFILQSWEEVFVISCVICWLLGIFALTPWSLSQSLSFYRWFQLAMAGFTFLLFTNRRVLPSSLTELILISSVLPIIPLFIWNIAFLLLPAIQGQTSTTTMLTAVYGHNHSYIYYLYVLVLSIYFESQKKFRWLFLTLIISSIVGIVFSFSRVGLFLLIVVLGYFILGKKTSTSKYIKCAIGLIVIYGITIFSLSVIPSITEMNTCIFPVMKSRLCKDFSTESRGMYLRQVVQGIGDSPLVGNGGGTFAITSLKYRQEIGDFSSMPHNEYLQLVYEFGVLGVVAVIGWFFLICSALHTTFDLGKTFKVSQLRKILAVIILIFSFDAVFHYKLSLSFLLVLFAMILGLYVRELFSNSTNLKSNQKFDSVPKYLHLLGISVIISIIFWGCGSYLIAEIFYRNSTSSYVRIFPYNSNKVEKLFTSGKVDHVQSKHFLDLYKNNVKIYELAAKSLGEDNLELAEKILRLDPMDHGRRVELINTLILQGKYDAAQKHDDILYAYFSQKPWQVEQFLGTYQIDLADASQTLFSSNRTMSVDLALRSLRIDPTKVNNLNLIFFRYPDSFEEDYLLEILKLENLSTLWGYYDTMMPWYSKKKQAAEEQSNEELIGFYHQKIYQLKGERFNVWEK